MREEVLLGKIKLFKGIKKEASGLLNLLTKEDLSPSYEEIFTSVWGRKSMKVQKREKLLSVYWGIVKKFNQEVEFLNKLLKLKDEHPFIPIPPPKNLEGCIEELSQIKISCEEIIGILESQISPLPKNKFLELHALKKELEGIANQVEKKYFKNIEEAIKECEQGSFLGSVLISSRIVINILEQFRGNNITEKIQDLKSKGLVTEKGEISNDYILKADKKARNYYSHDLNALPSGSEAIELLGICFRLLKLLLKYRKASN